jgi:DNA-binding GntR family transcriptional regulator
VSDPTLSNKRSDSEQRFQSLYTEIRNRITLLQYPPGTALREETLAEEFGVSRTPIRRVLQRLEFEELVGHIPGAGVMVTTIDLKSLQEVYKLRLKIAEFVGEMMVSRVEDSDIQSAQDILDGVTALRDDYDPIELGRQYHAFHELMVNFLNNRPLQHIQDQLFYQTSRVWLDILPDLDWEEEVEIVASEIKDVIKALRADDMQQVAVIRREHMSMLLRRLNQFLSSADLD